MELPPEPNYKPNLQSDHDYIALSLRHLNSNTCQQELINKECVVCGFVQNQWDYYQLPCLHYAHTRCMRHWIYAKQALECPWCQNLTPQKKYCDQCKNWGDHMTYTESCPIMQQFLITDCMEIIDNMLYSTKPTKKKSKVRNNKKRP